jgi:hypothetical protein
MLKVNFFFEGVYVLIVAMFYGKDDGWYLELVYKITYLISSILNYF